MSLQLIQQAICYMEDHILENINYAEVAKNVHMSNYNFHRTFSFIVGMTANEYIRKRRLTLAAMELQTTDISVIDVAYKYGYESPESFSKAFSRFHGSTPRQAKQKGAKLHLFNEISNDENDHSIPDFWAECYERNLVEPMKLLRAEGKRDLYGLCHPVKDGETHFNYGIGVIIDGDTNIKKLEHLTQNGYSIWETTPADYAVFKCFGDNGDCISETWGKFFKEFAPQTGYIQTDDTDYEIYFENGEKGLFCELWVPVKKRSYS